MDQVETPFEQACAMQGWSQPAAFLAAFADTARSLNEAVTVTPRQFQRWRGANPPQPRPRAWRVLNAMFGLSPTELGFPAPLWEAAPVAVVNRREFVADAVGAVSSLAIGTGADAVGSAHLLELREGLRSLYTLDDAYGGGDVRSLAVRHLRRVRRVINTGTYPDTIGRQLQLLAGETAEQCGWLYYDADEQEKARQYWGEALTTAAMIRDDSLEVLVLSALSMQAIHEDRPRDGYDLARAARERAERLGSPKLVSLIAGREARALSRLGDPGGARRELTRAMRTVERDGRGRPAPEWAAFHGQAELDFTQGLLNHDSGHHRAAVPFLRAALTHQNRSYGRNRALYRLTLARSLVQAGDIDEGAAQTVGSLGQLAEVESGRVTRRLFEVRGMLAAVDTAAARNAVEAVSEHVI